MSHQAIPDGFTSERNPIGWQQAAPCPAALYDAGGVQVGRHLYVVLGYQQISEVNERIFVLDLVQGKWLGSITPRLRIGHSHTGVCSDGSRFMYIASGQYGPHCCPAIPDCVSFDTRSGQWQQLPPLPEARYAGAMHLLAGRLHYAGGARPDRSTPASDHWSIGVSNGAATETQWRPEPPVPVAGMHRGTTSALEPCQPLCHEQDLGWVSGAVAGTYLHGVFESGPWRRRWLNTLRARQGLPLLSEQQPHHRRQREALLDRLADAFAQHINLEPLLRTP
jgi:hypothetical protein